MQCAELSASTKAEHHCGIVAIHGNPESTLGVSSATRALLRELWERGGAGWGTVERTSDQLTETSLGGLREQLGHTVEKVEKHEHLSVMSAIGHTRYITSGDDTDAHKQPFRFTAGTTEYAFAFNGNIANYQEIKEGLAIKDPDVDTEAIRAILQREISARVDRVKTHTLQVMKEVFDVLENTLDGAFNIVMIDDIGNTFAYREKKGMHPLVYAQTYSGDTIVASEDSAIKEVLHEFIREIHTISPGQLLHAHNQGIDTETVREPDPRHCFFEWVYFARDLSSLDDVSVAEIRKLFGSKLGEMEIEKGTPCPNNRSLKTWHRYTHNIFRSKDWKQTVAIGVPKSAIDAGKSFADTLGMQYTQSIRRNAPSGRNFLAGTPEARQEMAESKFDYDTQNLHGKKVYLTEDSVVRGTTMKAMVQELRYAGVDSIHVRIACPPIIAPCFYGIDFPELTELIAGKFRNGILANNGNLTLAMEEEIASELEVDSIMFLTKNKMLEAFKEIGMKSSKLCTACVTSTPEGYPTHTGSKRFEEQIQTS